MKHVLIIHPGTVYFAGRTLFWQGKKIEFDAFGQRLNGEIDASYTTDVRYPVWSPIDLEVYEEYR